VVPVAIPVVDGMFRLAWAIVPPHRLSPLRGHEFARWCAQLPAFAVAVVASAVVGVGVLALWRVLHRSMEMQSD
jgi:hypothetical protein